MRNAGNKDQLRPAGAGALPELGKKLQNFGFLLRLGGDLEVQPLIRSAI